MTIQDALHLSEPPVAVGFFSTPPGNAARWDGGPAPSGCTSERDAMTFTGLPDDEMYLAVPGNRWEAVAACVNEIAAANRAMEAHYQGRQAQFPLV